MDGTAKCEKCGWFGNRVDPQTGLTLVENTKHGMLCSSCRVTKRLETGYYEE